MDQIKFISLLFGLMTLFPACSDNKAENPQLPFQAEFSLPHARFFVVDSLAYSLAGKLIIHQKQIVFQTQEPILTAEYDPETKLLAVLGTRQILLIDPYTWTLTDQIALNGKPIHLKARKGKILVLTESGGTVLSVYIPIKNKLAFVQRIQKKAIRDFACNQSQIAMLACDSIHFLDHGLHPITTLPFTGGTAMAMSDSVLYAKQANAIWEYPIQNNRLHEGTLFY
ncbi:MAG: hypothetical protein ACYC1Q_01855 [Bacteroidia bacterium]